MARAVSTQGFPPSPCSKGVSQWKSSGGHFSLKEGVVAGLKGLSLEAILTHSPMPLPPALSRGADCWV